MTPLARIPLEGGGSILVEGSGLPTGPVQAGRFGDAVHDLSGSLQAALEPVTEAARATLMRTVLDEGGDRSVNGAGR